MDSAEENANVIVQTKHRLQKDREEDAIPFLFEKQLCITCNTTVNM